MNEKRILVALSGGVDSSVCAWLLKEQGWDVGGVVLKMSPAHEQTVKDAQASAEQLGIPLFVRNLSETFSQEVVEYFMDEYARGRTPNPCIVCNPRVKFRALLEAADAEGYGWAATGHYAGLERRENVTYLTRGKNLDRDQSYMLYRLGQRELSRLLFPLAALPKPEVREIARKAGLSCAVKPDSQEICFIPDNDYAGFIEARRGAFPEGDFISPEGTPCGKHRGIIHYTVGQRKRLGVALGRPVFIREIDPKTNRIYLADGADTCEGEIRVSGISETFSGAIRDGMEAAVKIRSRANPVPAKVFREENGLRIQFAEPQRAPARGQSAVLYDGEIVLGGGFID